MPNAGLPMLVDGETEYPLGADELADWHARFIDEDGVNLIGGCCGTTPAHIRALREMLDARSESAPQSRQVNPEPTVASLYGNVELRLWLGRRRTAILPIRFGVFGFADAGRVWLEGEDSDTWHPGYGGGLMAKLIGMPMMFSLSAATGDEGTRIYFLMGQSF